MRNRNWLYLLTVIIIAVLLYFFQGCLPKDETAGAQPARDPIIAPIAIAFFDAAQATTTNVKDVTITLLDSIGQVRTCNGDSIVSFNLDAGVMCLGIKKGALISEEAPYSFSFRAEAPDYSPIIQTVVVTKEEPMYIPLFMANIKTPPTGVATSTQQFDVADAILGGGLRDTIAIPNIGQLRINIPEGTELLCDGKPVRGSKGSLQVTFGDPLSEGAARVFPNGPLVTNAMDSNGAILASPDAPIFFQSLGWATIDMRVEGRKINGFSQDIEIELPVNPELTDPQGYPYSPGQEVPVWSLDENTGAWKQEFSTPLESQGESAPLQARIRTNHLSTWNLDFFTAPCPSNLSFTIINNGCAGILTSEVSLSTGAFTKTNVLSYVAGANPMELLLVPNTSSVGGTLQFRVYDTSIIPPGAAATLATVNLSNCTPSPTSLSILPASTGAAASCDLFALEVSLETATDDVPLCNNVLWYKLDSGAADDLTIASWDFAGHFDDSGVVRMTQLNPAQNYRFMVWWGATPASNSIRWSIEASLRTSTDCGATPYNPRLQSTFAGLGRQIRKRCYNNGAATCTDSGAGSGGAYNCAIGSFNSARGVFLRITNFPAAATPPPCS